MALVRGITADLMAGLPTRSSRLAGAVSSNMLNRYIASGLPPQARPRPTRLSEPVRRIVRDELRRARVIRAGIAGLHTRQPARPDPDAIQLVYDAQCRLVEARTPEGRVILEWSGTCGGLYRVTEERRDGREVVWTFERGGPCGAITRAVPVVRDRVVEEVDL